MAGMMNRSFEKIDTKIDGFEAGLNHRMDRLEVRIVGLEGEVRGVKEEMQNWRTMTNDHEQRIERLEGRTGLI